MAKIKFRISSSKFLVSWNLELETWNLKDFHLTFYSFKKSTGFCNVLY